MKLLLMIQFAALAAILLNAPILRQVLGFIYLLFVPGALILDVLRFDTEGKLGFMVFSAGLSIAFVMFVGVLINTLFPPLGISAPLSTYSLMPAIGCILLAISFVACMRDNSAEGSSFSNSEFGAKQALGVIFLSFIPFSAVFGAIYSSSLLLLVMIVSIAVLVVISFSSKVFPSQLQPIVVLVIALSVLFQISFISQHLVGFDVFEEFHVFRLTQTNSLWNSALVSSESELVDYNGMLSVTVLPTVYSNLLNISGEVMFKFVYPLFYSLVPLTMYQMYKQPYGKAIAFLAAFYFVMFPRFSMEERRQIIGELLLVLLVSLFLNSRVSVKKKKLLTIVLGAALIVSHYSVFYIFVFCALFARAMSAVLGKLRMNRFEMKSKKLITARVLLPILSFSILWYYFVTPDVGYNFLKFAQRIVTSFTTDFGNLQARGGTVSDFVAPNLGMSLTSQADVILNKVPYILIFVGFLVLVKKSRSLSLGSEYLHILSANITILAMVLVLPSFAPAFLPQRFYHVSLMFLAPVCIFGGVTLLELVLKPLKNIKRKSSLILGLLCVFFIVIFFFKIGFLSEITNDAPVNMAVSFNRMEASPNPAVLASLYNAYSPEEDVRSILWLSKFEDGYSMTFSDGVAKKHVVVAYGMIVVGWDNTLYNDTTIGSHSYVYLRYFNLKGLIYTNNGAITTDVRLLDQLDSMDQICSNGKSVICRSLDNLP